MKLISLLLIMFCFTAFIQVPAQKLKLGSYEFIGISSVVSSETIMNKRALKVIKDSSIKRVDEPTFGRIKHLTFSNGVIEVKVLSRLLKTAPDYARGFIGIAFHINDSNTKYESIYLRPANGRANDQVRRNHSIQYYSYPDYKFDTLRKIAPEKYESYADMALNQWITLRIEVKDSTAKLFLNNNMQPSLIVNDLKLGAGTSGGIGLWSEVGTEAYFTDLKITKQ